MSPSVRGWWGGLALGVVLAGLPACSGPAVGLVSGRSLDLDRPILVMVVPDFEQEGGAPVERSGFAVGAAVRQALASHGAQVYTGSSHLEAPSFAEARELRCAIVARATITDWNDSMRDWVANPDRLAVRLRLVSVDDGLTVGYGEHVVELANLQAARQSPFQLAPDLAQDLVDAMLEGSIEASDVPGGA